MKRVSWVTIGMVVGAHGVHGDVRVKPLTDFPDRFLETKSVFVQTTDGKRTQFAVERSRPHSRGLFVLTLRGVSGRDAAEALRGLELQVPRNEAVPLPEDAFYVFDLIGADVFTMDGDKLGQLVDVIHTGANDVFHVKNSHGEEVLIPALKTIFKEIDVDSGRIVVDLPEGLASIGR